MDIVSFDKTIVEGFTQIDKHFGFMRYWLKYSTTQPRLFSKSLFLPSCMPQRSVCVHYFCETVSEIVILAVNWKIFLI